MSQTFAGTPLTPLYRVVSSALGTPVSNAAPNQSTTFNTNIPSIDYYLNIRRTRWFMGHSAMGVPGANASVQVFALLSESTSKTSVVSTDTQFLDIFMREYTIWFSTAAGFIFDGPNSNREGIETHFFAEGVPTIATKLNLVASAIANVGNLGATNWLPAVQVEFELLPITSTIRDYLSKRIQIQQ